LGGGGGGGVWHFFSPGFCVTLCFALGWLRAAGTGGNDRSNPRPSLYRSSLAATPVQCVGAWKESHTEWLAMARAVRCGEQGRDSTGSLLRCVAPLNYSPGRASTAGSAISHTRDECLYLFPFFLPTPSSPSPVVTFLLPVDYFATFNLIKSLVNFLT
jgi:hypothetical protein